MNKYFLSIIAVFIVVQSLKVFDEMLHKNNELENSYPIISDLEERKGTTNDLNIKIEEDKIQDAKILSEKLDEMIKNANLVKGQELSRQCVGCHDFTSNMRLMIGPPLWKLVGRDSAKIKKFKYSNSLKNYGKKWSNENLYFFLENPKEYVKGTKMLFKGLRKSDDRINLILYLNSLK